MSAAAAAAMLNASTEVLRQGVTGAADAADVAMAKLASVAAPAASLLDFAPKPTTYALYHHPHPSYIPGLSDKYLSLIAPIVIYWLASAWFALLDHLRLPFTEKYRLHEPEEIAKRNKVSAARVVAMVVLQQAIQTLLGVLVLEDEATIQRQIFVDHTEQMAVIGRRVANLAFALAGTNPTTMRLVAKVGPAATHFLYWWGIPTAQLVFAFFVMDTWQYFWHRGFHESRFLYRHFHSHHHRLYVPYAFGALYNHPLEGLILDSGGAAVAHAASLMTIRQGIVLFTVSTLKTVCDHGGYAFPAWLDPLHLVFPNNAEYHDVHHQAQGLRYNYSQPFFIHFDVLLGTRMGQERFEKMREANRRKRAEERRQEEAERRGEAVSGATTAATAKASESAAVATSAVQPSPSSADGAAASELRRRAAPPSSSQPPRPEAALASSSASTSAATTTSDASAATSSSKASTTTLALRDDVAAQRRLVDGLTQPTSATRKTATTTTTTTKDEVMGAMRDAEERLQALAAGSRRVGVVS